MKSTHFKITGKVQGVFFRASTKTKADELGISGWVKNTVDGDVEVLAQGNPEQLKAFEDWCRKGPSRARVDDFTIKEIEADEFKGFVVNRES